MFDAGLIRKILKNPVYNGKIAFGRRTLEKVHGTRNEYKQVEQDEYLISEGIHEAIVSDEVWQAAQVMLKSQAKKYEHVNKGKRYTHTLAFWNCKMPDMWSGNVWKQVYQEKERWNKV